MKRAIHHALEFVIGAQRPDGEIPSEADPPATPRAGGSARNVFVSTFVHDALEPGLFEDAAALAIARRIRHGIAAFIAEQEEPDHTWRFFGRGARIDPDVDTTACAAAIRLRHDPAGPLVDGVRRFEDRTGLFPSYVDVNGSRYSWILRDGSVVGGYDRVVLANVARFLGMAGVASEAIWSFLEAEFDRAALSSGSPDYPNPLTFFFMTARAHRAAARPLGKAATARFEEGPATWAPVADRPESPLTCALAVLAWLYAGGDHERVRPLAETLLAAQHRDGGWSAEPFFVGGYRSRGLTTALATEALLRMRG